MARSWLRRRGRYLASLYLFALAFALGFIAILQTNDKPADVVPLRQDDPIADLLQWIPATNETERGYAAWVALPGAPLGVADAIDRLSLVPGPLALGRSGEFQGTTGISASQVTGWASAFGAGIAVLSGRFDQNDIAEALRESGYKDSSWRGVTFWTAPSPRDASLSVDGDDLRAMNLVIPLEDRLLLAFDRPSAEVALEAASGQEESLADRPELQQWIGTGQVAGIMVADQRDLAVECGVAGDWRKTDFDTPSGRTVGVVYRLAGADAEPMTSVWIDLADELAAEAGLVIFDEGWREGFVNQVGLGGPVSALATVADVRRSGTFVVADLAQGRDNGWVRSGVRFLVDICEQSSAQVPPGQPIRATPIASPSPEEGE